MIKVQHCLKHNARNEAPQNMIFVDTETVTKLFADNEVEHVLKLGVGCFWHKQSGSRDDTLAWITFYDTDTFWAWAVGKAYPKTRLYIVAHNIQFDMGVLKGWDYLETTGWRNTSFLSDGHRQIWKFKRDKATLVFIDEMNIFPVSLRLLGDSVGELKGIIDFDHCSLDELATYCHQDVFIMLTAWQQWLAFLSDNDLGNFSVTLAGQAFNAFRHRFMAQQIFIHANAPAAQLERDSYRGGRVEAFTLGQLPEKDYYMVDVNSMYPFAMKTYNYPVNLISTGRGLSIAKLSTLLKTNSITAECIITTSDPVYGVKHHKRLIYPIGTFKVTLTTRELLFAIDHHHLVSVGRFNVYENAPIFGGYVDWLYNQRQQYNAAGNKAYTFMTKIMLNSLYGKFGQANEVWESYDHDLDYDYATLDEIDADTGKLTSFRWIDHRCERKVGRQEGYNSLVSIASEVAANARLYLWELINIAGKNNVFYGDTDSLIVNQDGVDNLAGYIDLSRLGALKIEAQSTEVEIDNVKWYTFGDLRKHKGLSNSAIKLGVYDYQQQQSIGIKQLLKRRTVNHTVWRTVRKHIENTYNKGVVLADHNVKPLLLLHEFDTNFIDFEAMLDRYGEFATYRDKFIDQYIGYTSMVYGQGVDALGDWSRDDRLAIAESTQLAKQRGELIYQRGI